MYRANESIEERQKIPVKVGLRPEKKHCCRSFSTEMNVLKKEAAGHATRRPHWFW